MPNYPGRRKGTRRIVIWANGKPNEWIIEASKAEGDKFEAEKRVELQSRKVERRGAESFSSLFRAYALHAETHLKESTWRKVRQYQVATLEGHFGDLKTDEWTSEDVDAFKRWRLRSTHRGKPISPVAVNNDLRVLKAIVSWGREAGHSISDVKWKRLKRRGSDRVKFWTREELGKIFDSTRELCPELMPLFIFMLNTGCRKGEAIAARWDWIDFKTGTITIPATDYWQPKSGRSRDVPMADAVRAVLTGPRRHRQVVFPSSLGKPYKGFPKDPFGRILRDCGVRGNPHMFRHTFAANFLAVTKDMRLLADILGHSTIRVTEIYSHLLPGQLERARNAVNLIPQTMAVTMAKEPGDPRKQQKTG